MDNKEFLRIMHQKQRHELPLNLITHLNKMLYFNFFNNFKLTKHTIAGYISINNEIDVENILRELFRLGHNICLPSSDEKDLVFRKWDLESLQSNKLYSKLQEPSSSSKILEPDIILAPLVVADLEGNRIGYGKGYYDRYIAKLRTKKNILYVGTCYDFQLQEKIPREPYDEKLDIIITDKRIVPTRIEKSYF